MTKLNLSSIQNNAKKHVENQDNTNIDFIKDVKNDVNNDVYPDFKKIVTKKQFNIDSKNEFKNDVYSDVKNQFDIDSRKNDVNILEPENKKLDEWQRKKLASLLQLYVCEFPEKLQKWRNKDFTKMDDEELLRLKQQFNYEVNSTNSLNMSVELSKKMLFAYEFAACDLLDINIKGISKIGDSDEWNDTVKALTLKYMNDSLITSIEPEYKLGWLLISNSILLHQVNSANENNEKINNIEQKTNNIEHINSQKSELQKKLELNMINNNNKYTNL